MPTDCIQRDGFSSAHDRFFAIGRVERVEGAWLRANFLPRLTPAANKKLRDGYNFVAGQLQHYGIEYDPSELNGNGTNLLKKFLKAGKCDKVPDHINQLRQQMHKEWLNQLNPDEIAGHPDFIMARYFLDSSSQPDRQKTTNVVGIPLPTSSSYRARLVREAADKISGLHYETSFGHTQTIHLGWNQAEVQNAVETYAAKESRQRQVEDDEREESRAAMHEEYLADLKRKKVSKVYSPVGSYIVDCEEIEGNWPDLAGDMSLDIRATTETGVFESHFQFGVIEGIMILSTQKTALNSYCAELDRGNVFDEEASSEDEDTDAENSQDHVSVKGSKRKATLPRGRPPKKAKMATPSRTYFLLWKGRETGEGMILSQATEGAITFDNGDLASLKGTTDMHSVGQGIVFTARKVSDTPSRFDDSWDDFSEAAYEKARVGRW